jgi:acyl-CoA synthetase (AMP-forming)/AMP-acid ligase II
MRIPTTQAGDYLRLSAQRYPDRDCFVFDHGSSRSFAETNHRVNKLADAVQRRGIRKGDRVAILATDSGEYVEVILACMKIGVTYVPLNNRLTDFEVVTLLDRAQPKALFVSGRYVARAEQLASRLSYLSLACSLDGDKLITFADLLAEGADVEPDVEVTRVPCCAGCSQAG